MTEYLYYYNLVLITILVYLFQSKLINYFWVSIFYSNTSAKPDQRSCYIFFFECLNLLEAKIHFLTSLCSLGDMFQSGFAEPPKTGFVALSLPFTALTEVYDSLLVPILLCGIIS